MSKYLISFLRLTFVLFLTFVTGMMIIISGIVKITAHAVSDILTTVPSYTGKAYVEVNNNIPDFEPEEYTYTAFESYSELDTLGRCGEAYALVCEETMPEGERGSISSVIPTGWIQAKYDTSLVSGGYLYNRCHLIGWQLTGENANKKNLITGTRYLNIDGMLGFEDSVAEYVKKSDGHVLYRVTPVFIGNNLLASGVLMEGFSVDDAGKSISFCVYCFNVQPGIYIDYSTGSSSLEQIIPDLPSTDEKYIFVITKSSGKYHLPSCRYAVSLEQGKYILFTGTHSDINNGGYNSCSICKSDINGILIGNVDGDEKVTVADARLILRQAIGLENFDKTNLFCADADLSYDITVADARLVLRMAIGLE